MRTRTCPGLARAAWIRAIQSISCSLGHRCWDLIQHYYGPCETSSQMNGWLCKNVSCSDQTMQVDISMIPHLVCRRGMGREIQRNGSKVLLCLRQWGHVKDDLRRQKTEISMTRPVSYVVFALDQKNTFWVQGKVEWKNLHLMCCLCSRFIVCFSIESVGSILTTHLISVGWNVKLNEKTTENRGVGRKLNLTGRAMISELIKAGARTEKIPIPKSVYKQSSLLTS